MQAWLTHQDLVPFHFSLIALVVLGLIETIGIYFKKRPSHFLKKISPQKITNSPFLNVKFSKVMIVIFFLMNFSFFGYLLQLICYSQTQNFLAAYYLFLPAFVLASFFTVFMIHCLDQVIKPRYSKKNIELLGHLATISSGNARPGFSAQARVRDEYGQIHYVQVEPEFGELEFQSKIILIRKKKSHYVAKKISKSNSLFSLDE